MDKFGYFGIDLLMIPFWIFLYLRVLPHIKKSIIKHGIYGGVIAMATEHIFIKDYWVPPPISGIPGLYIIEDFMYGFLIIGITATLYDWLYGIEKVTKYPKQRIVSYLFVALILGSFTIFSKYYGYNSTFVISMALFISAVIMVLIRRDLMAKALISGFYIFLIFFLIHVFIFGFFLTDWWHMYWLLKDSPCAFYIFNTPWTEYMWYVSFGFFMSIISDFSHGSGLVRKR